MLSNYLQTNSTKIRQKIETTNLQWNAFLKRLEEQEQLKQPDYHDEQVWTFLIMSWYADGSSDRIKKLAKILTCNDNLVVGEDDKIWLEALPIPPRMKEGNTNLDMAIGRIARRPLGKGDPHSAPPGNGIQYAGGKGYVCFCEMKWYSDIDTKVTHDRHRNQLIRVIENALAFRSCDNKFPDQLYVTLVTPQIFKDRDPMSRFYAYKFREYTKHRNIMIEEIKACSLKMRYADEGEIVRRLKILKLNWVTYEDLMHHIEDDELGSMIKKFHQDYLGYR